MSEVGSCFGEVREVRHRARNAFHVLYLDLCSTTTRGRQLHLQLP
jgi:hypothetical protein